MHGELEVVEPLRELVERDECLRFPLAPRRPRVETDLAVPEPHVLFLQVPAEVHVDRRPDRAWLRDDPVGALLAVHEEDHVRKEIQDRQIVFYDDDVLLLRKRLDDLRDLEALVDVEVRRRLVEEVDVRVLEHRRRDRHPLEFPAGELGDVPVKEGTELEGDDKFAQPPAAIDLCQ